MFNDNFNYISWNKVRLNVIRLQRRIFKSVYLGDLPYALCVQKLLILSNSARLLSIRYVTHSSKLKSFACSTDTFSVTFLDKFKINELLLRNASNWYPVKFREITFSGISKIPFFKFQFFSTYDRCWSYLIILALKPAHKASFSPRSFSSYCLSSFHKLQRLIFLNLSKESFGLQKRVLLICFNDTLKSFDNSFLLKTCLAPRGIKLGIFRFLKLGLKLYFNTHFEDDGHLGFFLANILFNGVDFIFDSLRLGSNMLVFVKPNDNEIILIERLFKFLSSIGIDEDWS